MTRIEYIIDDDFLNDETKMSAESQGYLWKLIRCKDCKHFNKPTCPTVVSLPIKSEQRTSGWVETFRNTADDYCSRAERKEDDTY